MVPQKQKKVLKVPRELEVLKGMNEEELKKYFFPNNPVEPWYYERQLGMELDGPCKLDGPPPPIRPPVDAKHDHHIEVTSKLAESIRNEFRRPKFQRMKANEIKPGEAVDLKSLLFPCQGDYLVRRKGRGKIKAKNLKGKYILVCCCYAPIIWGSSIWRAVYACSEMYSKLKGNFEMVVVTKMRHGWTHTRAKEKDAFRQFISAFPPPCLAVPFHARSRRHRICNSLGAMLYPKILLLGPDGKALLHTVLCDYMMDLDLVPLNVIGSDPTPFPFISRNCSLPPPLPVCSWMVNCPSSLKHLLSPSSDFVFRKMMFSQEGGSSEPFLKREVSLSDLNSKPVALYLYSTGEKLPLLRQIVEGCGQTNKDLEVVVVYRPIDDCSLSFPEIFSKVLADRRLSWWVAPYNFSASIVLEHLFQFQGDRVIIIGPNEQYVDVRGLQFMQIYGIYAYPFTFDSVVRKTVEELRQVTLDSFLKLLQFQEYSSAKKVLLYFDYPYDSCLSVYKQIRRFVEYEEVDMRIISFANNERFGSHAKNLKPEDCKPTDLTLALLWHTKGADKARDFFLRFFNHEFPTVVAFGEDGRICSLLAHNLPPSDGPEFKGNLHEEVSSILEKYVGDYDEKEYDFEGGYDHGLAYRQELRQSKFW